MTVVRKHVPSLGMALIAVGAVSLAFLALYVAQPQRYLGILTVLLEAIAMSFALATMLLAIRGSVGRERKIWLSLIVMTSVFLGGTIYHAVWLMRHQLDSAQDPMISWARVGLLLFLLPIVVMFTQTSRRNRVRGVRSSLDSLAMMVGISALTFYAVLLPRRADLPAAGAWDRLFLAAIPSAALALAVYSLVLRRRSWAAWRGCITVGLFAGVLGVSVHDIALLVLGSGAESASRTGAGDGLMIAAFLLLAMAGIYRLQPDPPASEASRQSEAAPGWNSLVGSALSFAGLLVLLRLALGSTTGLERVFAEVSMVIVAFVIVGKEALVSSENRELAEHAMADPVTGLFSRRRFMEALRLEVTRSTTSGTPLSLCVFDIVDLSAVNRVYGYAAGDTELRRIGELLNGLSEGLAMSARIGGDDLALLLPSTTADEARAICVDIVAELSASNFETGALRLAVGIAEVPRHAEDVERLMEVATGAAHWSASMGEDDVVVYDPLLIGVFDREAQIQRLEKETHTKTVESLAAAVDARDHNTRHHSQNTADLAKLLAELAGLSPERAEMIHVAGLLHDVGKIGVSDKVLLKAGALTPEEVHQIREHPALGERIMRSAVDPEILSWVRAHHERWDGNGYPDGLMAEHIPLEARILAVCDSFDAMRSDRTYRRGMSIEQSLIELQACSGSQFDPELVVLLEEAVRGQRRTFFEALAHPGQGVDHLGVAFEAGT